MTTLNRTAIVVMPGRPFLDWLHRADPTSSGLSLEDLRREPTVYLRNTLPAVELFLENLATHLFQTLAKLVVARSA